jgi:hypothetical protein
MDASSGRSSQRDRSLFRRDIVRDIGVALLSVAVSAVVLISMVLIAVLDFEGADSYYLVCACISGALFASFFASKASKRMKASQQQSVYTDLVHAFSVAFLAIGAFSGLVFLARTGYDAFRPVISGQMPHVHALGSLVMLLISVWIIISLAVGPSYNRKLQQGKQS